MKKVIITLLSFAFSLTILSQVKISGKTKLNSTNPIQINLLYGAWFSQFGRSKITINSDGTFEKRIDVDYPIFADLRYNNHEAYILLIPKRNLEIYIDENGFRFDGKAAPENRLLQTFGLREEKFFESHWEENKYSKMTKDSINRLVIEPFINVFKVKYDSALQSHLPSDIKRIVLDELQYGYQFKLYHFTHDQLRWARNKCFEELSGKILELFHMPSENQIQNNFFANVMLEYYNKSKFPKSADSVAAIESMFHEKVDTIIKKVALFGEKNAIIWLYTKYNLSEKYRERTLLNNIIDSYDQYDFEMCKTFADSLKIYFPKSKYLPVAYSVIKNIDDSLEKSNHVTGINFYENTNAKTLKDIVEKYKGKVVYLDIWGTWCGPCINEIRFGVSNLKEKMKGKDIVFLYIDKDEEEKDKKWKEFVRFHKLTGEHYRMTQQEIDTIWRELKPYKNQQSYPTFVIFDRNGTIVNNDAARPSELEIVVKQLEDVLEK